MTAFGKRYIRIFDHSIHQEKHYKIESRWSKNTNNYNRLHVNNLDLNQDCNSANNNEKYECITYSLVMKIKAKMKLSHHFGTLSRELCFIPGITSHLHKTKTTILKMVVFPTMVKSLVDQSDSIQCLEIIYTTPKEHRIHKHFHNVKFLINHQISKRLKDLPDSIKASRFEYSANEHFRVKFVACENFLIIFDRVSNEIYYFDFEMMRWYTSNIVKYTKKK